MALIRFALLSCFVLLMAVGSLFAQAQKARLPRMINVPTKSHIYPSLTSDETYMIFYSNYSNTGNYELKYSKKLGPDLWKEPEYIQYILKSGNDHFGSFSVSPNGQYLLFSSYRAGGIGKYDILISERSGDQWSQPVNPGKPLNSPGNDGNASMAPDGRSIYFMRCDNMDETTKSGCKIYVSHKRNARMWGEPEELPSYINSGNTTSPRILSDNQTLIYSCERPGNMGKLDLYLTRMEDGIWSQPLPLDIINSVRNDEFVSIPARGDIVYYTDVYKDQFNIAIALLPQELRPKKVVLISGKIANRNITDRVNVQAYDAATGKLVTGVNLEEGENEFEIILPEGKTYDFSIFPLDGQHTFYSTLYDLELLESSRRETLDFTIDQIRVGESYPLDAIKIDTIMNDLSMESDIEVKRLISILQKNPSMVCEIQAFTDKPMEIEKIEHIVETGNLESIQSNPTFDSGSSDFAQSMPENSTDDGFVDLETIQEDNIVPEENVFSDTSQVFLEKAFQTQIEEVVRFDPELETQNRADIIVKYLIRKGVPQEKIRASGKGYSFKDQLSENSLSGKNFWYKFKMNLY